MRMLKERPVALQRDLKLEEPPNRRWRFFVNWLLESLTPAVPVVSTTGASSLKSPASIWLWAIVLVFALSNVAHAVPTTTSYQGYLENSEAEPLNATINMTFALYEAAEGGDALWTETHQQVVVTNGVFSLVLGSVSSFENVDLDGKRFLGIRVGGDAEMSPRQELTSGFSALRAGVADSVGVAAVDSEAIVDDAVTGGKIKDGSISANKIVAGVTITAAERSKLESIALEVTEDNNILTFDQLNVKKHLKIGENSIHFDSSSVGDASENEIYTSDNKPLVIQPFPKTTNNVGIGLVPDESAKLDIRGGLNIAPVALDLNGKLNNPEGGLFLYSVPKPNNKSSASVVSYAPSGGANLLEIVGSPIKMLSYDKTKSGLNKFGLVEIVGKPIRLNSKNVSIGFPLTTHKNQLDVAGSVAIGSAYAGIRTAPANGLIIEGNVGIGTANIANAPTIHPAKLDVNGTVYTRGDFLVGKQKYRWIFHTQNWTPSPNFLKIAPENQDANTEGWDWSKGLTLWKSGGVDVGGGLNVSGGIISTVNATQDWWQRNIEAKCNRKNMAAYTATLNGSDTFYVACAGWIYSQGHYLGSDIALKKDIEPLENSLQKVLNLKGVTYRFKTDSENSSKKIGLVAQDVEKVVPEVVQEGRDGIKMVAYQNLVALVIEATKEQQSQINMLKVQNDALKTIVCKDHPEKAICQ